MPASLFSETQLVSQHLSVPLWGDAANSRDVLKQLLVRHGVGKSRKKSAQVNELHLQHFILIHT